jgi:hypothetical protein
VSVALRPLKALTFQISFKIGTFPAFVGSAYNVTANAFAEDRPSKECAWKWFGMRSQSGDQDFKWIEMLGTCMITNRVFHER